MNTKQNGFTLIELVVVIVILGILAATALPKFIDLSSDAAQAAIQGVAGGLGSASAVNYAARKANPAKGVAIANCTDVANAMQSFDAANFSITAAAIAADATATCTVSGVAGTKYAGQSATFAAIGIS